LKDTIHITLYLNRDKANFLSFLPLLQREFLVETQGGRSIKQLLCDTYDVDEDYLKNRINTLFLDGKPVDDVEATTVNIGSTVALSAAMPGLVGATLRKGGSLANLRSSISYDGKSAFLETNSVGMVGIKLFNMVVKEIGPVFLQQGILVKTEDFENFFNDRTDILLSITNSSEKDGQPIAFDQLAAMDWPETSEYVFLKVLMPRHRDAQ
jgi:hypothetical protein